MIPIIVVTSEDPDFSVKTQHPVIEADFAKDICDRCVSLEATDAEPVKCIKTVSLSAITVFFYYGFLKLGIDVSFWMIKNNPCKITQVGVNDIFTSFNQEYEHVESFFEEGEYERVTDKVMSDSSDVKLSLPMKETYNIHKFDDLWSIGVCTDLERSFRTKTSRK